MNENSSLQERLEDRLQLLILNETAPPEIKKEVMRTLDLLELVGDVTDLFTDKFVKANTSFLGLLKEKDSPNM